ncbi:VanZ family protein [Agromyces sp. CFH 90414]|uniref:VanZ family protein n=1 Tax=Agromyces agglutinans TaxID=2662258 RepID=A0A6I2FC78_9MICO|nr:VanZ family protein [Agromyces agglutinans]MRG60066.1 VanZ family protein [Agromyces agglutinans]
MPRRVALPLLTAAYLALVAWATLGPVSWHAIGYEATYGVLTPSIWLDRSTWTTGSMFEFVANVAMFLPVGVLFAMLAGPRRWVWALVGAGALSLVIELAQIPIGDRISDPRDLLANATGALVGVLLAAIGWVCSLAWRALTRQPAAAAAAAPVEPVDVEPAAVQRAAPQTTTRPQAELSRTAR